MKMTKKTIIAAAAVLLTTGVAGSISGSLAWYRYSTESIWQMIGTSIGGETNLKIAVADEAPALGSEDWKENINTADVQAYVTSKTEGELKFKPLMTESVLAKNTELDLNGNHKFHLGPHDRETDPTKWRLAKEVDYIQIPVWLVSVDGKTTPEALTKDMGIIDAQITNKSVDGKKDISSAVRVHVQTEDCSALLANVSETDYYGGLDMFNEGHNTKALVGDNRYSEADDYSEGEELVYGLANAKQTSYDLTNATDKEAVFSELSIVEEPQNEEEFQFTTGLDLGVSSSASILKVTLTIWLEGWQKLVNTGSEASNALWSEADYSGSKFHIGITFGSADVRNGNYI